MFEYHLTTLKSGLQVLQVPMQSVESLTVLVLCNTGSRYEEPRVEGIAHFLEHMVFKGTAKFPNSQSISVAIDEIGADANAFTSKEYTGYYVKAAAKHLERALDVVSDMLLAPKLLEEDIQREKGVIIEEINMYYDTPTRYIVDLFERMFFRGSGLSHDIIGTKETISQLNQADFLKFLKQWYGVGNLVVVVAGHAPTIQAPATKQLIEEMFSKGANERAKDRVALNQFFPEQGPISPHRLHIEHRATEQAHVVLGWPGLKRSHPDRYALSVLSTIVGGNMSSRLFSEVREKRGLCYYVHSDTDYYHDAGIFGASAGVDPKRIEEAIKVIIAEFEELASGSKNVTPEELAKAKEYIMGTMTLSFEDSRSVAQYLGLKQVLNEKVEDPEKVFAKVRAVTIEDTMRVAKQLIKDGELRLAVIGPFENQTPFEQFVSGVAATPESKL